MSTPRWTPADIPDQTGRRAIVTGANSGIGFHTALELARRGIMVVLASRDPARGAAAKSQILTGVPNAQVELASLDLASLASVQAFAESQSTKPLDLLINNAGVMAPPRRKQTADGFELQFGTNVLGHFALTARLLPALTAATQPARVVTVSSIAHKRGRLDFADLQSTASYSPMRAYQQSKLADLMFAFELQRRLHATGSPILSVAAHPGVAETSLFLTPDHAGLERAARKIMGKLIGLLLNSQAQGAYPTLYAATSHQAVAGGYYGPQGLAETRGGDAGPAHVAPQALDQPAAAQLWTTCQQLTGLTLL